MAKKIFIKLSPDLEEKDLVLLEICRDYPITGFVCSSKLSIKLKLQRSFKWRITLSILLAARSKILHNSKKDNKFFSHRNRLLNHRASALNLGWIIYQDSLSQTYQFILWIKNFGSVSNQF